MIVIDMGMPTKCMNCQLLGRDVMYCQVYPRKDLNLITVADGKPEWCPIKCDIEDIKAEIISEAKMIGNIAKPCKYNDALEKCLEIIDKYIKGEQE